MSKAGARAAHRKKIQNPVVAESTPKPSESKKILEAISEPRVLSTFCFSTAGLLAGLMTGLNHFPDMGAIGAIPQTLLLAAYLGDPHLDFVTGAAGAFAGLAIGGCLGFSALSNPRDLGIGVLSSAVLGIGTMTFTGNLWLTGLAVLLGHLPVFLAYRNLQRA